MYPVNIMSLITGDWFIIFNKQHSLMSWKHSGYLLPWLSLGITQTLVHTLLINLLLKMFAIKMVSLFHF